MTAYSVQILNIEFNSQTLNKTFRICFEQKFIIGTRVTPSSEMQKIPKETNDERIGKIKPLEAIVNKFAENE